MSQSQQSKKKQLLKQKQQTQYNNLLKQILSKTPEVQILTYSTYFPLYPEDYGFSSQKELINFYDYVNTHLTQHPRKDYKKAEEELIKKGKLPPKEPKEPNNPNQEEEKGD